MRSVLVRKFCLQLNLVIFVIRKVPVFSLSLVNEAVHSTVSIYFTLAPAGPPGQGHRFSVGVIPNACSVLTPPAELSLRLAWPGAEGQGYEPEIFRFAVIFFALLNSYVKRKFDD